MANKRSRIFALALLAAAISGCEAHRAGDASPRRILNFDFDWKFARGDFPRAPEITFDDGGWERIDLPHDWSISGPFLKDNPSGRSGAFAPGGIGWYRKTFTLDRDPGSSMISVEFGGVYMNSEVWINGHYLGKRPYGYISFGYDLTPFLEGRGGNVLAVRVDNSKQPNARWYTGSGIYRHVRLVVTNKTRIARHGIHAIARLLPDGSAGVEIKTSIENDSGDSKRLSLVHEIYSPEDERVARKEAPAKVPGKEKIELPLTLTFEDAEQWSPDQPSLYELKSFLISGDEIIDEVATTIGIREFRFSADSGFFLNGEGLKLKGVNNHGDLGALGAALNDRVLERRLEILKTMGCNAVRTAHNPPSEVLLDLCDRMGFMVMDEAFDEWIESWPWTDKKGEGKSRYGYHLYFEEWAEKDLIELIRRDRNHPCVILWSVGNEIPDACYEAGVGRLKRLMEVARREDPTRPVTSGITHMHLANASGFAAALDVVGYNGGGGSCFMYEQDHEAYPERKFVATEVPHTFQTRGVYRTRSWYRGKNPLGGIMEVPDLTDEEVFPDVTEYYSSSYDNAMVRISARDSWRRTRDLPFMSGEFRWTGFDYLGETLFGWPAKFWNFGVIDMCGFPKDTYYFYQSRWAKEPMVHILPHWNWRGKEGTPIPVVAYSNCDSVEMFLNGVSLGEKQMGGRMDLVWHTPFQAGVIRAEGKTAGRVRCAAEWATSGDPAKIRLSADRETLAADGMDVVHIEVDILDEKDRFVPDAGNPVSFEVEGEARILAVDNGDPLSRESFQGSTRKAFNGKCLLILKSTRKKGSITVRAESDGLAGAVIRLRSRSPRRI